MKFNVDRFLTDIYHYCEKARLHLAMNKEIEMAIFIVILVLWLGTRDFA